MSLKRDLMIGMFGLVLAFGSLTDASAATWRQMHPRRTEVNHRLADENLRIHRDVAQGDITAQEAARLHSDVHSVRSQERFDGSLNDGHITKAQQRALNQDETDIRKQIY